MTKIHHHDQYTFTNGPWIWLTQKGSQKDKTQKIQEDLPMLIDFYEWKARPTLEGP